MKSNINETKKASKLKILWHSVAPWIASGYGKTTREVCRRLQKHGFKMLISAYYGAEPGGVPPYEIPVLPSKNGPFGIASAAQYCKQYHVDLGVLFTDWWAFSDFPKIIPRATLYGPMDHINYPELQKRFSVINHSGAFTVNFNFARDVADVDLL